MQSSLSGTGEMALAARSGVSCRPTRDKSCLERVLSLGPPKAQPPGNAQAHERQTLAISGERSRQAIHRRGAALEVKRAISQVLRTEGRSTQVLALLCSFSTRLRWALRLLYTTPTSSRAPRSSTSAAG